MTVLTKTSGYALIDEHVIELEPGQVCSYRDDKPVSEYPTRRQLLDGFKALYPARYQAWLNNNAADIEDRTFKHPPDFTVSFVVVEAPATRVVLRFRGVDQNNYQALVVNRNGVMALAQVVDGVQSVLDSAAGAVTYGDKVQLHVSGDTVRAGVNGEVAVSYTSAEGGNLARINLDGAAVTRFDYLKL